MNNWNRSHPFARLNWAVIVFLYIAWWPAGLALTFLKLIDQKQLEKDEQARQDWAARMNGTLSGAPAQNAAASSAAPGGWRPAAPYAAPHPQAQPGAQGQPGAWGQTFRAPVGAAAAQAPTTATPEQLQAKKSQGILIAVLAALALVFILTGLPDLSNFLNSALYGYMDSFGLRYYLLPGLAKVLGGAGLGFCSSRMRVGARREKLLATIVGTRDCVTLQELSAASGYSVKKTSDVLKDAIAHGLFGAAAYIDVASQSLIVRGAPQRAPAPAPQAPAKPAPVDENKYQAILRQLRELNDAIPGEEMSAKIDQLEQISARIFALAEKDPNKVPQLNRFMDYYLPTALKLLSTYATLDQQGVGGENISETKASIENAMDMLVQAFSAQLDKLFANDALDVSGDIAALKGMLNMDGLTGAQDFPPQASHSENKDSEL